MKTLAVIFITIFSLLGFAQKQGNIWYFGPNGAGLDFNYCPPLVLTNGWNDMNSGLFEGSTSISDTNGTLLFYSNGASIFNSKNYPMQNGNSIGIGNTMTQNIIIPKPGSSTLYYLFSPQIQATYGAGIVTYAEIDMSLDGGLGSVISYGNILRDTIGRKGSEKLTATKHINGKEIWLVGHDYYSSTFFSYLISSSGISATPIESSVGPVLSDPITQSHFPSMGELKFSPDGDKICFTSYGNGTTAVFNFDRSTGKVSNPILINLNRGGINVSGYGVSFSSDNSKLYISSVVQMNTSGQFSSYLNQFDITIWDSLSIQKSWQIVDSGGVQNRLYSLKLGPDKKIYAGKSTGALYLGVINFPNQSGLSCNYVDNGIYLNGLQATWGLNNNIEMFWYCPLSTNITSAIPSCHNQCTGTANAITWGGTAPFTYLWSNGQTSPTATTLCAGNYSLTVTDAAGSSITSSVSISQPPALNLTFSKNNTCSGAATGSATLTVTGGTPAYSYLWSNGKRSPALTKLPAGVFTLTLTDKNACTTIDSVAIGTFPLPSASITGDSIICTGQLTTLTASGGSSYKWSTGDTTSSISVSPPLSSLCTVTVTDANSCSATATYTVTVNPRPTVTLTHDTVILAGDSVQLTASGGLTYLWQPATSLNYNTIANPIAAPAQTTTYTLTITDINGCVNTASCTLFLKPPCIGSERDVFIPNIFSPNNDGKNDVLKIEGNGLTSIYWAIFDRWGNLFFETRDQSRGWDGNKNGTPALSGTYVYYLKAVCIKTNTEIKLKGNVSLVR